MRLRAVVAGCLIGGGLAVAAVPVLAQERFNLSDSSQEKAIHFDTARPVQICVAPRDTTTAAFGHRPAPMGRKIPLRVSYDGKVAEVQTGHCLNVEAKDVTFMGGERLDYSGYRLAGTTRVARACELNGIFFSSGSASCQAGTQYRCDETGWTLLGMPCSVGDAPLSVGPSGRACMSGPETIAHGSTICRAGFGETLAFDTRTLLCNDGEWMNLRTQCR